MGGTEHANRATRALAPEETTVTLNQIQAHLRVEHLLFEYEPGARIPRAYVIKHLSESEDTNGWSYEITASYTTSRTEGFAEAHTTLRLRKFSGSRPLSELPLRPRGILPATEIKHIENTLVNRAAKLAGLKSSLKNEITDNRNFLVRNYQGTRITIERNFQNAGIYGTTKSYEELTQIQKLTCDPFVNGYLSKNGEIVSGRFNIDLLQETSWDTTKLQDLPLESQHYEVLIALANCCFPQKRKGESAMVLLKGESQTGKTATALAVAEYLQVPVHTYTPLDLDMQSPRKVLQNSLETMFETCAKWGLVIVFEDFDKILDDSNMSIAVPFILKLAREYPGMTIFTTRAQFISEDLRSRMDYCILMTSDMTDEDFRNIWRPSLRKETHILNDGESGFQTDPDITDEFLDGLLEHFTNIHEIENAARVARKIANGRKSLVIEVCDIETLLGQPRY